MNTGQLLLEFADAEALTRAADTLRDSGRWQTEWLGPATLGEEELAFSLSPRRLARGALYGGLLAGLGGFTLQLYASTHGTWDLPAQSIFATVPFLTSSIELAVLGAALGIFTALLWGIRLPRLLQPHFDIAHANGADDHFFLLVYGEEWQHERVLHLLRAQPPIAVRRVDSAVEYTRAVPIVTAG
jgi:ActD protein